MREAIDYQLLRDLVARLPERERLIIERLFWDGDNLTSIAKDLRVSIPRVHQLKEQAIARLREWMGKERPTR
jgi:RNA polymerase sigma factor for flagellar operon FliA